MNFVQNRPIYKRQWSIYFHILSYIAFEVIQQQFFFNAKNAQLQVLQNH